MRELGCGWRDSPFPAKSKYHPRHSSTAQETGLPVSVRKSLLITFSQSYFLLLLQFSASLVIARLLTPAEIGLFSVSVVLIGIGNTLRDFGVVDYIVQEKELTEARLRAAILMTTLTAWLVALAVYLMAPWAAVYYRQEGVEDVLHILSLTFVILPFSSVSMAFMRRQMQFATIAKIRVASGITQASVSVLLAYLGYSFYSMAWGALAGAVMNLFLVQFSRPKEVPWLPHPAELKRVFSFGSFSSMDVLVRDFDKGAPEMILGRLSGMESVAFFGRAAGLVDMFNRFMVEAVAQVALPHFSANVRAGKDIGPSYLHAIAYLTGVAWPFFAMLGLSAWVLVPVLYGPQWGASVPILEILCIGELLLAPFYLQNRLFVATGLVRMELLRSALAVSAKVAPLILLAPYGLEAVAIGYLGSYLLAVTVALWLLRRHFGIGLGTVATAVRQSFFVLLFSGGITGLVAYWCNTQAFGNLPTLFLLSLVMLFAWLGSVYTIRHPIRSEIERIAKRFVSHRI